MHKTHRTEFLIVCGWRALKTFDIYIIKQLFAQQIKSSVNRQLYSNVILI